MATVVRKGNMRSALAEEAKVIAAKCAKGTRAAADKLLELSRDLVPLDTTTLQQSGHVLDNGGQGFDRVCCVGYGSSAIPEAIVYSVALNKRVRRKPSEYALLVHELGDFTLRSEGGRQVTHLFGQSNYLREPCLTGIPQMRQAFNGEVF